jgi:hypothetical protein
MAKKKKPKATGPDPSTSIEIKLPTELWNKYLALKARDQALLTHMIRATFDADARYGMDFIKFSESTLTKADLADARKSPPKGFWKLCEGD